MATGESRGISPRQFDVLASASMWESKGEAGGLWTKAEGLHCYAAVAIYRTLSDTLNSKKLLHWATPSQPRLEFCKLHVLCTSGT